MQNNVNTGAGFQQHDVENSIRFRAFDVTEEM